ncbi:hypothetical protein BpHYR1_027903 [Brachionus plicatilis]|uniref:Uncharacterized protein n=1 Tax=Brachionus plicatilis TaxID=10195 RepID=A0A3M7R0C6_BRAPC|nr:hypothetical protein BpHYR1_027903 [Brachionus plicatilis]
MVQLKEISTNLVFLTKNTYSILGADTQKTYNCKISEIMSLELFFKSSETRKGNESRFFSKKFSPVHLLEPN